MPDGRRINRADLEYSMNMPPSRPSFGIARADPPIFSTQESALANSLLAQQQFQPPDMFPPQYPFSEIDENDAFSDRRYNQHYPMTPLEAALNSPPGSHFGSPPDDFRLPRSPIEHLRTALNAPMPQSFDSNGVSHIAQYGPLGHSLPDKFGLKSHSAALPRNGQHPAEPMPMRSASKLNSPLAASPQNQDYSLSSRIAAAQRLDPNQGHPLSVPKSNNLEIWDDRFHVDAGLLPNSLHDEVLTPQERMRRLSRPDQPSLAGGMKDQSGALAIPGGPQSKVGSAPAAGSPSRFRALWEEQREKKGVTTDTNTNTIPINASGQVGSPLRESWMPNPSNVGGVPMTQTLSHSPLNLTTSLSGISQQISQTKLSSSHSNDTSRPYAFRSPSSNIPTSSSLLPTMADRNVLSSPKIQALSGRRNEDESFFFPMDSDVDGSKRSSIAFSGRSPALDPIRDSFDGGSSPSGREGRPMNLSRLK